MKYESIKTVILTILIIISIVLTWQLWTYQPHHKTLEKLTDIVEENPASNTKDIPSLVKPMKILFHKDGQHFATFEESEINKLMKYIRTWEVNDVKNISSSIRDFTSFIKKDGHAEIIFADKIPLQIFKSLLNINDKEHSLVNFDRIIINVNDEERGEGKIYFISYENQIVYEAKVNSERINSFKRNYYLLASKYPEQVEYKLTETSSFFLPKEETKMTHLVYYTDIIEVDHFVENLFTEPNNVKKDVLQSSEVHTDGTRMLKVFNDQKYIQFVNPMLINNSQGETTDLIQTSIDFVNEHGGWTGNYQLFSWNKNNQKVVFRLHVENYPVFNRNGLTEIDQIWGKNEIMNYEHPLISLRFTPEKRETELPGGDAVMKEIESIPDFQANLVENITIGYELIANQKSSKVVSLQPIWCYKYDGNWIKVEIKESDNLGGDTDGLE
ncbi:YycH family regulatory protein [Fredinandcohnia quinoae]|uniref:Two-component system activity regulator YycH n=1 Tax=Fredinandcohnia quinoae TaxID=2918902 RepID=A0AAW5E5E0_9BACI|nr:two-component system activity regulator YycH [Fredinandcohnia sp. SECRCQ15]MCH1626759.1 two-component system activity regulator YycH [Fredinandcohnia sp. SECRCQ15]